MFNFIFKSIIKPLIRRWRRWFGRFYSFKLYMIRPAEDGSCHGDEVVEVERSASEYPSIELIYNELLSLRSRDYGDGLINALWESDLSLERAYVDGDDVAHVYLSGNLVTTGDCASSRIPPQLERPALQVRSGGATVRSTEVYIDDQPLAEVLAA